MGKTVLVAGLVTACCVGGLVCLAGEIVSQDGPVSVEPAEADRSSGRLAAFVDCRGNPGEPVSDTCREAFDWDGDTFVTLRDWAEIEVWISQQH